MGMLGACQKPVFDRVRPIAHEAPPRSGERPAQSITRAGVSDRLEARWAGSGDACGPPDAAAAAAEVRPSRAATTLHPTHCGAARQQLTGVERGRVGCRDQLAMLSEHDPEVADRVPQRRFAREAHTSTNVFDRASTRAREPPRPRSAASPPCSTARGDRIRERGPVGERLPAARLPKPCGRRQLATGVTPRTKLHARGDAAPFCSPRRARAPRRRAAARARSRRPRRVRRFAARGARGRKPRVVAPAPRPRYASTR